MAQGQVFDLRIKGAEQAVKNIEHIGQVLEQMAPIALAKGAEIPMEMMRRLVPVDTGNLKRTIRFEMGNGGKAKTGTLKTGALGRTRITGRIIAGDGSTIVTIRGMKGNRWGKAKKGRGKGNRKAPPGPRWQNAWLQEFGTQKMAAKPYFFVSYRAMRNKMKQRIGLEMRKAFRLANKTTMAEAA